MDAHRMPQTTDSTCEMPNQTRRPLKSYLGSWLNPWLFIAIVLIAAAAATIVLSGAHQQAATWVKVAVSSSVDSSPAPSHQVGECRYKNSTSNHPCLCTNTDIPPKYPLMLRPELMILMVESSDRKGRAESGYVDDNFQRYCKLQGCLFQHLFIDAGQDPTGFFGARWREIFHYWDMADWLLMIDSDTVVSNLTNSIHPFLNVPEHVILHLRLNREVAAGVVAIRTTDFGRCFLQRWLKIMHLRMMYGRSVNADNSALLLNVAEYLHPELARNLSSGPTEIFAYISKFEPLFPYLPIAHTLAPIRIYMPFGGFWRQHDQAAPDFTEPSNTTCNFKESVNSAVYYRCWWNDILASGWKSIGLNSWANVSADATLARCPWNTPAQSLEIAKLCCYHRFPGCVDAKGVNVCEQQPWCQDPQAGPLMQTRARIGFGICWNHQPWDNAWSQSPLLGKKVGC